MSTSDVINGSAAWHVETCDVLDGLRMLPDSSVHCCVTSPPYWGLRDYGMDGQLGLEPTPSAYIAEMVAVFSEVRRVLRDDGTLWLNIGDSYCGGGGFSPDSPSNIAGSKQTTHRGSIRGAIKPLESIKPKDLVGIPWMLAFALRDSGWYLRSEIIWHKRAPMPESVTDRPTKAHEQVFLLSKERRYFYDAVASGEQAVYGGTMQSFSTAYKNAGRGSGVAASGNEKAGAPPVLMAETRNLRSVWSLSPESFSGAHFATMPTELVRKCLLAGTSEKGCCSNCGTPWRRVVDKSRTFESGSGKAGNLPSGKNGEAMQGGGATVDVRRGPVVHVTTTGWEPGCECSFDETHACVVLDPFNGAGTTGLVARRLGLRYIGFELNPEYAEMARKRIRGDSPLFN